MHCVQGLSKAGSGGSADPPKLDTFPVDGVNNQHDFKGLGENRRITLRDKT